MRKAWNAIRGPDKLVLDEPTAFGPYLGCEQSRSTIDGKEAYERLKNILPLLSNKLATKQSDMAVGSSGELAKLEIPAIRWEMDGFFSQCIETYEKLAKQNGYTPSRGKRIVTHPSIDDHQIPPEDFEEAGKLAKDAAKIVMKLLYGCRFVRFDYLWPCGDLARRITKWTKACDRRMDRLMEHLRATKDHALEGFMGDTADKCHVVAYCDASFADDLATSKSTSGFYLAIVGPNTFMPVTSFAKRQTAVSHSTTESEMVSLEERATF